MVWTEPNFNRGRVDAAGDILLKIGTISEKDRDEALAVINNWRSAHSYPLQSLKMTLLGRAKKIDTKAIIAQRLKRLSSIAIKLKRNKNMKLTQMQDIGGCRAVLQSVRQVEELVKLYKESNAKNPNVRAEFVKNYDYILNPKNDGYRSFHLVYKYRSNAKRKKYFNGLRIEIQLRTRFQHSWATAVETVSVFTGQALKSNVGDESWKRFFALMGSEIAYRERRPKVPGTPTNRLDLAKELQELSKQLKIEEVLTSWGDVVQTLTAKATDADAFLLVLDSIKKSIRVTPFKNIEMPMASEEYLRVEKENELNPSVQAVLVSVNSLQALRSAYPNYYLDTSMFIDLVRQVIEPPTPFFKNVGKFMRAKSSSTTAPNTGLSPKRVKRA